MISEIPVFFPTSFGPIAGMVTLPDSGEIQDSGVLLLTGDAHSRTRVPVLADVARQMAASGYAGLRFDYPGAGLSAWGPAPKHEELAGVARETADWFLEHTGCTSLMTAGHCLGARLALFVAASNKKVSDAVAVGCPIRQRRVVQSRVRSKLAQRDRVGPALSRVLPGGARSKDAGTGWYPGLIDEIVAASAHAQMTFVYGSEDEFYSDLVELLDVLDPEVRSRVGVSVLRSAQLRALTDLEHHPWVATRIQELFIGSSKPADD